MKFEESIASQTLTAAVGASRYHKQIYVIKHFAEVMQGSVPSFPRMVPFVRTPAW